MEAIQARSEGHRRRLGGLSLWRLQHKDRGRRWCWGRLRERERERDKYSPFVQNFGNVT